MLPDLTNELCCELNIFAFLSVFVKVFHQVYWLLVLTVQATQQRNADRVYCCLKWRAFQLNMWMRCHSQINSCSVCVCVYVAWQETCQLYHIYTVKVDANMIWHVKMRHLSHCVTCSHLLLFISRIAVFYALIEYNSILIQVLCILLCCHSQCIAIFIHWHFIIVIKRVHFRIHTENRSNENKK